MLGLASDTDEYQETTSEMLNVICHNCQTIPYIDTISISMTPVDDDLLGNDILNPRVNGDLDNERADPVTEFFARSITQKYFYINCRR